MNGIDYATPDGICVRDYVHVSDLADAHVLEWKYLRDGGKSDVFNCGYGHGCSVREFIDEARTVTGKVFRVVGSARREGDSPVLAAENSKLKWSLAWTPQHDDLCSIIRSGWEWEKKAPRR